MDTLERTQSEPGTSYKTSSRAFFTDLVLYLVVMFSIREIYFPAMGFMANGLFWSLTTLVVASWRMKARQVTWAALGLCKPRRYEKAAIAALFILAMAIGSIVVFQIISDQLQLGLAPDTSDESAVNKFGNLKDNWGLFFSIIPLIWFESFLEEVLDRGFLMNWIERMFSSTLLATVLAVIFQAVIFGFRHSYDLSERSITVGLIGLAMGVGYVAFGRNLWPLIIAHCTLNTVSMLDRV